MKKGKILETKQTLMKREGAKRRRKKVRVE
jgi:hypothetical protein